MNNFKAHEDAVDLTEKYSAYQLAKMLLESEKTLAKITNNLIDISAREDTMERYLVDKDLIADYTKWVDDNDTM